MRTASMALGIVGGALAIIFSFIFFLSGALVSNIGPALPDFGDISVDRDHISFDNDFNIAWDEDKDWADDFHVTIDNGEVIVNDGDISAGSILKDSALDNLNVKIDTGELQTAVLNTVSTVIVILGIVSIVGGGLAIAGGIIVRKKNVMGGVFMLVGGVMSAVTVYGILSMIVLILGGIFAFVPDKSAQQAGPQATQPQIEGPIQ